MRTVLDLTKDDAVRILATPAAIRLGHEIVAKGEVIFGAFRPEYVEARVASPVSQMRHTIIEVQVDDLRWTCTCTADSELFCKHLVATALAAQKEGRGDIVKAAGIIIQNRKLLHERSIGKPAFIAPGGRLEAGEAPKQALVRELKEECSIDVREADLEQFGTYTAEAANHPGQKVIMDVFMVKKWSGDLRPGAEVEEFCWLDSRIPKDLIVGSVSAHEIIPRLKQQGLID
ncbi:MAG TPA: NUDIX domain-containing protein [Patescibacteria group bacterium]|nr:NUDIX domain-containing protein [Patescibacteria group bacterium]